MGVSQQALKDLESLFPVQFRLAPATFTRTSQKQRRREIVTPSPSFHQYPPSFQDPATRIYTPITPYPASHSKPADFYATQPVQQWQLWPYADEPYSHSVASFPTTSITPDDQGPHHAQVYCFIYLCWIAL